MDHAAELQMLRAASWASKTGAWRWTLHDDSIVWTDVTHELFDVPRGRPINLEMGLSFYDEESRARLVPAVEACRQHGTPWDLVLRCSATSGRRFWARSVGVPLRDSQGEVIALEGALQDVTAEHEAREAQRAAEGDLEAVLDTMPSGFFVLDEAWRFVFLNPASEAMLRRAPDTLVGKVIWEEFPEAVGSDFEHVYRNVLKNGVSQSFTAHFHPLHTWFLVSAHRTPLGIAVHFRDVTVQEETKTRAAKATSELRKTHDRLSLVANVAPVGLYEFRMEPSGKVSFPYCSDRFIEMLGLEGEELQGSPNELFARLDVQNAPDFLESIERSAKDLSLWVKRFCMTHPDHGPVWYQGRSMPRLEADGAVVWTGALLDVTSDVERETALRIARDVAEAVRAEKERQALTDDLTGLPNRRAYDLEILARVRPETGNQSRAAVSIRLDLDHFKYVNDTLGHEAGDLVLKRVADILRMAVRRNDFIARIGGDEFAILMAPQATEADGQRVIRRIQKALAKPVLHEGRPCRFGASFGLISTADVVSLGDDFQRFVDAALYRAKEGGRNRVQVFTPEIHREILHNRSVAVELQDALEEDQLVPYFQPQISAVDGRLVGVETLLRWHHPKHGILNPPCFMKVAEQLHLVPEIDRRVMELSRDVVARLAGRGLRLPKISFNVSPGRMQAPDLIQCAKSEAFGNTRITFELLESILLEEESSVFRRHLHRIRDADIGIEIDDFGSGHASILSVMQIAPTAVKIDRRLIAPLATSHRARKMVRAIMEIAHTLDVATIAEGVETREQARILREEGCDTLQGFLFARALSEADLFAFAMDGDLKCA